MKPPRFVVGLTGGFASGKSEVLREFARGGAAVVDLDGIARSQARPGGAGHRAIVRAFGRSVLAADGAVDRARLGERVFRDPAARRRLERATHPHIRREMARRVKAARGVVVVAVPLLFESGLQDRFDATLLVSSRPADQVRRAARRDGLTPAQARRRLAAQWPLARKAALADAVIENDSTLTRLRARTRAWHEGLKLLYGGTPNGNADQDS